MKFLVVGAGAVGGLVGGRLAQANYDVTLVARGAHLDAIRKQGLSIMSPFGTDIVHVPAVERPVVSGHVVLLAVKTHDVAAALRELALVAPASTPIVCMTNGTDAERTCLRWFEHVYAMCVNTPATYLEPGIVEAWGTPTSGMFDIGRYPDGADALCTELSAALVAAKLDSRVFADIMRWKRGKLVFNLSNAIDALCGPNARTHPIIDALRAEARRVYAAANLSTTNESEAIARRGDFRTGTIEGRQKVGGSTWQSLARGAPILECEFLNGEIALLGRQHHVPTPLNDALLREVTRAVAAKASPGDLSIDELAQRLTQTT